MASVCLLPPSVAFELRLRTQLCKIDSLGTDRNLSMRGEHTECASFMG